MDANEERLNTYHEAIKDIPKESLVYIDESGIDSVICKDGAEKKESKAYRKKSGKHCQKTNIIEQVMLIPNQ